MQSQEFTANGVWVCPQSVSAVFVQGQGGGGGLVATRAFQAQSPAAAGEPAEPWRMRRRPSYPARPMTSSSALAGPAAAPDSREAGAALAPLATWSSFQEERVAVTATVFCRALAGLDPIAAQEETAAVFPAFRDHQAPRILETRAAPAAPQSMSRVAVVAAAHR